MIAAQKVKQLENILIVVYICCVIAVYVLSATLLDMYTTAHSHTIGWCVGITMGLIAAYISTRLTLVKSEKWYGYIGNFVGPFLLLVFSGYYTCMKTDLLISALIKPTTVTNSQITAIKKITTRRAVFDHTNVTLRYNDKNITFKAGSNFYFLLKNKKTLNVNIGQSFTGNYFITDIQLPAAERWAARSAYFKDWAHRHTWIAILLIIAIVVFLLILKFGPKQPLIKRKPYSFTKLMLIIMGIIFALGLLAYLGLIVYVKFIM